ncbi:Hypothetical Protein FCC1311_014302 [Hondaea fermentalgiana]|uniref:Uncharacterized protein n=1 Tax=Hondaea fermentalgiana TaxID=2315210 RepID=A0A2R5G9N1_9STRA|nr:Hypothetical Protein FCC1311_014302 [Hondaea fermentalgiana]|eukprot:GBG25213.1 Hypothetical Protein FCC1311_014302 [Hondaea fermentalgiana]
MEVAGVVLPPRRLTIWERIVEQVPGAERDEVREILGPRLVEKNESLCQELDALREILIEFQQQNREFRDKLRKRPPLPEHPARILLEQQILLLLNSVKTSKSIHAKSLLQPTSRTDREVCDYVLKRHLKKSARDGQAGAFDDAARPGTSCGTSRSDRYAFARRPGTASSAHSAASFASAPVEVIDALDRKALSVFAIDKITKDLRAALEAEEEDLLQDIDQIQALLELEHEDISIEKQEALKPPPPLEDMREYSAKLEKTWLLEDLESSSSVPSFLAAKREESKNAKILQQQRENTGSKALFDDEFASAAKQHNYHLQQQNVDTAHNDTMMQRDHPGPLRLGRDIDSRTGLQHGSPRTSRTVQRLRLAVSSGRQAEPGF